MHSYNISFIGAGNVASHLAQDLFDTGHSILQVYSRTMSNAQTLADDVRAEAIDVIKSLKDNADIYIISIKDDAIEEVAGALPFTGKIILHTSGSVATVPVKKSGNHFGVLYPLQTFSKMVPVDMSKVPVLVDGENEEVITAAKNIASSLTHLVVESDEKKRLAVHVAAVFANNFTNHNMALAEEIMKKEGFNFDLLKPLIETTFEKVRTYHPSEVQTGPAARRDNTTILKHEEYLKNDNHLLEIYKQLTASLENFKKK